MSAKQIEEMRKQILEKIEELRDALEKLSDYRARRIYKEYGKEARKVYGAKFDPKAPYVDRDMANLMKQFITHSIEKFKKDANDLLNEAKEKGWNITKFADELRHVYNKYDNYNSPLMAQWLNVKARNMGAVRAYLEAGYRLFKWVAKPDACPVCKTFHNRVINVAKGEKFARKGQIFHGIDPDTGDSDRLTVFENLYYPPAHPRCRCEVVPLEPLMKSNFADRVRAVIGQGVKDYKQAIEVGKLVQEEIIKRVGKNAINQERILLKALQQYTRNTRTRKKYKRKIQRIKQEYLKLKRKRAIKTLEVLDEIRDFNVTEALQHEFADEILYKGKLYRNDDFIKNTIRYYGRFYPRKWHAYSVNSDVKLVSHADKESLDSYYFHSKHEKKGLMILSQYIWYFAGVHEFAHRFESVVPGLKDIIKSFYDYRTHGDQEIDFADLAIKNNISRTKARKDFEGVKAKLDRFPHWYMSRQNGDEILSTGMENLFNLEMVKYDHLDDEIHQFILGLLAGYYGR